MRGEDRSMGRHHGTYVRHYMDVWTHPKTLRLAEAIIGLKYPRRGAIDAAVGQLMRLAGWCLTNTEDGRLDHLPADLFARVLGWDDMRTAAKLREAWLASGFLDIIDGGAEIRLHEFDDFAEDLLASRAEAARKRAAYKAMRSRARSPENGADTPRILRGESKETSEDYPRSSPPILQEISARSRARPATEAEAETETETATEERETHTRDSVSELSEPLGESELPTAKPQLAENPGEFAPTTAKPPRESPEALAAAFRELAPALPQPRSPLAAGIRRKLVAALNRDPLEAWRERFRKLAASSWHAGSNSSGWIADIVWATGPENAAKIDAWGDGARPEPSPPLSAFERERAAAIARNPELWAPPDGNHREDVDDFGEPVQRLTISADPPSAEGAVA